MKALIADDHALIRDGIRLVLNRVLGDAEFLEADNFADTREILATHPDLDLLVMDLFMPGVMDPRAVSVIRNGAPTVPIIVLSMSEDPQHMRECLKSGANGYIPKSSRNTILYYAIKLVMEGGVYVPPEMLDVADGTANNQTGGNLTSADSGLTDRQTQVLTLMAQGRTNKEIARLLDISDNTVKTHTTTIFRQLGVNNRTQAVNHALLHRLVLVEAPGCS